MHIPISINTLGLINGYTIFPVTVNTDGFLLPGGAPPPVPPDVKNDGKILATNVNFADRQRKEQEIVDDGKEMLQKLRLADDNEIIFILKLFMRCQH